MQKQWNYCSGYIKGVFLIHKKHNESVTFIAEVSLQGKNTTLTYSKILHNK